MRYVRNDNRIEVILVELATFVVIPSKGIVMVGKEPFDKLDFFQPKKTVGSDLHHIMSILSELASRTKSRRIGRKWFHRT
jgi:hypothetical protein